MNQLSKLQHIFQNSILHTDNSLSTTWVSASGRTTPATQLSIYSFAYRSRLKEVLANDFPAVLMAIGDEQFDQLTDDYIKAFPSHYFSLREFGKHMPDFILDLIQKNQAYKNNHWLFELSLFEWTLGQSFDAADATLITENDMTSIPIEAWPDLKFIIHPSVQRLDLEWNIPEMWQALTNDNPTEVTAQKKASSPWLFWREQLVTRYRSMQTDEQLVLDMLIAGNSFNDICETLASIMDENKVSLCAASFLKAWITQSLISGIN